MKNHAVQFLMVVLVTISLDLFSQAKNETYKTIYHHKSQKIAIVSGEVVKLADIKSFNAIYKDDNLTLGLKGEEDSIYIKRKVSELNAKINGRGDEWKNKWEKTASTFLPAFIEGYTEGSKKSKNPPISQVTNPGAPAAYTMVIRPLFIDFNEWSGHTVGMYIDITKNGNPDDTIVRFLVDAQCWWKCKAYPGVDPGAFFSAGKDFATFFKKVVYKTK